MTGRALPPLAATHTPISRSPSVSTWNPAVPRDQVTVNVGMDWIAVKGAVSDRVAPVEIREERSAPRNAVAHGYSIRIKPNRRRVQMEMPQGLERRRH